MLKILGRRTSANVMKPLWVADELGLDYEQVDVGGKFGGNREPGYLAMNPMGLVPTLVEDDFTLWEFERDHPLSLREARSGLALPGRPAGPGHRRHLDGLAADGVRPHDEPRCSGASCAPRRAERDYGAINARIRTRL